MERRIGIARNQIRSRTDESDVTSVGADRGLPGASILCPVQSNRDKFRCSRLPIVDIHIAGRAGLALNCASSRTSAVRISSNEIGRVARKCDVTTVSAYGGINRKTIALGAI